ncbi:MAG: UDP-N-acetylglucosamine 2-epimerase (hydrolyzing) [Chitinophagales bacterium]|nr:UDP-N-acetylglucosamine 2-epimerase (hydrolyzing) [Chitinophagales bacterium]
MKIGVLTSSRADFGIYLPLLKAMADDDSFDLHIIAFGTHLSKFHGYTLHDISKHNIGTIHTIDALLMGDTPNAIAGSYALTAMKFADFWNQHSFDLVFALGDRFEMAAAVAATIPFGLKIAHLHGGETTLGAIDNIYRHAISHASTLHFVSLPAFKQRLSQLLGSEENIYVCGALSLENLKGISIMSKDAFRQKWNIDANVPYLLVTLHPETVALEKNEDYAQTAFETFTTLLQDFHIIVTMPNADTSGIIYRRMFEALVKTSSKVTLVENFGTEGYFSCMQYAQLLIGNTSSGIIEAASFGKYVLNIGNRQQGRIAGENVIHLPFQQQEIVENARRYAGKVFHGNNIYSKEGASAYICETLKKLHNAGTL